MIVEIMLKTAKLFILPIQSHVPEPGPQKKNFETGSSKIFQEK